MLMEKSARDRHVSHHLVSQWTIGNSILTFPYHSIRLSSDRYENQYLIVFSLPSLVTGRIGRCQRDTETRAVGHSIEEDETRWDSYALLKRLLQSRSALSVLATVSTAAMAGDLTKAAHNSAFRTKHCVDSLLACVTRAASASEPREGRQTFRERAVWKNLSAKRCAGATTNCAHKGTG